MSEQTGETPIPQEVHLHNRDVPFRLSFGFFGAEAQLRTYEPVISVLFDFMGISLFIVALSSR